MNGVLHSELYVTEYICDNFGRAGGPIPLLGNQKSGIISL